MWFFFFLFDVKNVAWKSVWIIYWNRVPHLGKMGRSRPEPSPTQISLGFQNSDLTPKFKQFRQTRPKLHFNVKLDMQARVWPDLSVKGPNLEKKKKENFTIKIGLQWVGLGFGLQFQACGLYRAKKFGPVVNWTGPKTQDIWTLSLNFAKLGDG